MPIKPTAFVIEYCRTWLPDVSPRKPRILMTIGLAMPDPRRLDILTSVRKGAGVTLAQMARACGLTGGRAHESASAWERGLSVPHARLRHRFVLYLMDTLQLREDRARLLAVWRVLESEWGWPPLAEEDWQRAPFALEHGAPAGVAERTMRGKPQPGRGLGLSAQALTRPAAPGPLPPGSIVPFAPDPLFVGRAALITSVLELFAPAPRQATPPTIALSGPAGVGKTQVALEFAHRYGRLFKGGVFWMSFSDAEAAQVSVAACAGPNALALGETVQALGLGAQADCVRERWAEPVPRLLVFDGCEDPQLLARWRPYGGGCRVLVTSRRTRWPASTRVYCLPVGPLSRDESLDLLRRHCPGGGGAALLTTLAAELHDLPLALSLAGSFLARCAAPASPELVLAAVRYAQASLATCSLGPPGARSEAQSD